MAIGLEGREKVGEGKKVDEMKHEKSQSWPRGRAGADGLAMTEGRTWFVDL